MNEFVRQSERIAAHVSVKWFEMNMSVGNHAEKVSILLLPSRRTHTHDHIIIQFEAKSKHIWIVRLSESGKMCEEKDARWFGSFFHGLGVRHHANLLCVRWKRSDMRRAVGGIKLSDLFLCSIIFLYMSFRLFWIVISRVLDVVLISIRKRSSIPSHK